MFKRSQLTRSRLNFHRNQQTCKVVPVQLTYCVHNSNNVLYVILLDLHQLFKQNVVDPLTANSFFFYKNHLTIDSSLSFKIQQFNLLLIKLTTYYEKSLPPKSQLQTYECF